MSGPDYDEIDKAMLIATLESATAARHAILNRLSLCQGTLLTLWRDLKEGASDYEDSLMTISEELKAIGTDLDALRRVADPRTERPQRLLLSDLVDGARADLSRSFEGLELEVVLTGGDLALEVLPGPARVAFLQLFFNSLDGFRRTRRRRSGRIWIEATRAAPDRCRIVFRDDGPGIDLERLGLSPDASAAEISTRIFGFGDTRDGTDRFCLPIARRLLEGLGGDIVLLPSPQGVRFEIGLPLPQEQAGRP